MTVTSGSKSVRRKQAIAAARWVRAMITGPAPATARSPRPPPPASPRRPAATGPVGGLGLGGVSELAAKVGALLAWLATAASGGWVLARWLLAGGSPLRRTTTAAPPAVILGHVGAGALGLVLWASFMLSGWVALAWTALALSPRWPASAWACSYSGCQARRGRAPARRGAAAVHPDPGPRHRRTRSCSP